MGKPKPLHRHPKVRLEEYKARAVLLGGEFIPGANLIQITEAGKPTIWYCANRIVELPDDVARRRLWDITDRHKARKLEYRYFSK